MAEYASTQTPLPEATHPPSFSLPDLWPYAILAIALLTVVYFVGADEGAASMVPGTTLHEWVHDGRHLLGFPCH